MKTILAQHFSLSFDTAIQDVERLLEFHDVEVKRKRGRPKPSLEVLKRAGIILAVTAWETFIEDALKAAVDARLGRTQDPRKMLGTFNAVASEWLRKGSIRPPDLIRWTQDGWKGVVEERFRLEIGRLSSPDSVHLADLTRRYLSHDVTQEWHWQRCHQTVACKRLDKLIKHRGELVHRSREIFDRRAAVNRYDLVSSIDLLKHLVERTEKALGFGRREISVPDPNHAKA